MPENDLLPCPFCGGIARTIKPRCPAHENCGLWGIGCGHCKTIKEAETFEEAQAQWNTRSNDFAKARSALGEMVKEWEREGAFLDNPHDHAEDRAVGRAYKECAKEIKEILAEFK
jgi:uncharacterized protein YukE